LHQTRQTIDDNVEGQWGCFWATGRAGEARVLANSEAAQQLTGAVEQLEDPVDRDFVREFQRSTIIRPVPQAFFETVVQESIKLPARVWKDVAACMADDFSSELHKIAAPTLLVWGEQDALVPRSDQDAQLAAIADSQLEVYEGTGHSVHWEQPERFANDLVNFIEEKAQ
jgi:non-heme chloroperoxidase